VSSVIVIDYNTKQDYHMPLIGMITHIESV